MVCVVIVGIGIFFFNKFFSSNSAEWQSLSAIKEYSNIFDQPITEITLRKSVDSAEWAIFDDDDLIKQWTDFLKNVKVKREKEAQDSLEISGGGILIANIQTEASQFSICLESDSHSYYLKSNGYLYAIKSDTDVPFETYETAVERHGLKSPWD